MYSTRSKDTTRQSRAVANLPGVESSFQSHSMQRMNNLQLAVDHAIASPVIQRNGDDEKELEPDQARSAGHDTHAGAWVEPVDYEDDDQVSIKAELYDGTKMIAIGTSISANGTHAERDLIQQLVDLKLDATPYHLVIWISKSPCTSTSRGGLPVTGDAPGCTERLLNLAENGIAGTTFTIDIIAHHLYKPGRRGRGVMDASRAALRALLAHKNIRSVRLDKQGQSFQ